MFSVGHFTNSGGILLFLQHEALCHAIGSVSPLMKYGMLFSLIRFSILISVARNPGTLRQECIPVGTPIHCRAPGTQIHT